MRTHLWHCIIALAISIIAGFYGCHEVEEGDIDKNDSDTSDTSTDGNTDTDVDTGTDTDTDTDIDRDTDTNTDSDTEDDKDKGCDGDPSDVIQPDRLLQTHNAIAVETYAADIAVGDLNGDGFDDIVTVGGDMAARVDSTLSVALSRGNGEFEAKLVWRTKDQSIEAVAIGEFTGDEFQDLVLGFGDENEIWIGNGKGEFEKLFSLPEIEDSTSSISIADLNGDQLDDIVLAGFDTMLTVLITESPGQFAAPKTYTAKGAVEEVQFGDINSDGIVDMVHAGHDIGLLIGLGQGEFEVGDPLYFEQQFAGDVAVGDIDQDGALDIVASEKNTDAIYLYYGAGDGTFAQPQTFEIFGHQPLSVAVVDLNLDGAPEVITGNRNSNNISILINNCSAGLEDVPVTRNVGTGDSAVHGYPHDLEVGDFNNDGISDLATANLSDLTVSALW
ncbi:MAG: VCBS repeat-containing protein [Proteobacteria bacterium]|nr:VCBS repeat-containing protein [Pseudomonadota bacterium]